MKVVRSITIEAEVWGGVQEKGLNASAICNEALRLASQTDLTGNDGELSASLKRRADIEKQLAILRRIHDKKPEVFAEAVRRFCVHFDIPLADAVAAAEGRRIHLK